jgi:UrcA family protein
VNTQSAAAILMSLCAIVSVGSIADQPAATETMSADVSLSDLDLSTPQGMRQTRDRLHAMAERICADESGGRERSPQPTFGACVDSTVANALRHIDALRQTHMTVLGTVTLGAGVSLADLDLSTPEGAATARRRLGAIARRLCGQLARRQDLAYPASYAACVQDTLARTLARADDLAAARTTERTARRSAP